MARYILYFLFLVSLGGCKSCTTDKCDVPAEVEKVKAPVKMERIEEPFFKAVNAIQMQQFLRSHAAFADLYLQGKQYPSEEKLIEDLLHLTNDTYVKQLHAAVKKKFNNLDPLKQELETAFKFVKYFYPEFKVPAVKTFISGYSTDITLRDSLLVISLENFLEKDAPFQSPHPKYTSRRYQDEYIVPGVMLAVSQQYNKTDFLSKTLLAEMVYGGKAYYFAQAMLPCTPDSLLLGYSAKEITDSKYNEGLIWAHFIDRKVLYETNHRLKEKYVGERPAVTEIGNKCPGRIGIWTGLQIVREYMKKHPEVTLQQLMAEKDAQKIFMESKYKPKKP